MTIIKNYIGKWSDFINTHTLKNEQAHLKVFQDKINKEPWEWAIWKVQDSE